MKQKFYDITSDIEYEIDLEEYINLIKKASQNGGELKSDYSQGRTQHNETNKRQNVKKIFEI